MSEILNPQLRHLFIYAHHDDEIPNCGMIRRLAENAAIAWVTNSDGLYYQEDNMSPAAYAEIRVAEGHKAAQALGIQEVFNGNFSEVENYHHFVASTRNMSMFNQAIDHFTDQGRFIYSCIEEFRPDMIWTYAFQGGHPEHDLVHLLTRRSRELLCPEIPLFEMPAYELSILLPFRFNRWYEGQIQKIRLSRQESQQKSDTLNHYASQAGLVRNFRRIINLGGLLSALGGKPFSYESYCSEEHFAAVPERNYTEAPYRIEFCNYMFDDYQGEPIRFRGMMDRIFHELQQSDLRPAHES